MQRSSTWLPPLLLALCWGVGPAIPAWLRGELIGHPFTDLYPSVWGLWAFARAQPALPSHTDLLGYPGGMGFYYSSPIKGWLAWPLIPFIGLSATWNLLVLAARVGTVLAAYGAARAWGLGRRGALAAAAVYGCSPFFHGYAVEGIVEGTDGWTLALWAWAVGRRRYALGAGALALTVLSSWYLGMAACLLAAMAGLRDRRAWLTLLGVVLVAPAMAAFLHAFPARAPLPDSIRGAMGARPQIPAPGIGPGLSPFAINTYIGWVTLGAAIASRRWRWLALAAVPAVLSLGKGPWYHLPILDMVRFPYRWHAATLVLLAPAVGRAADRWRCGLGLGPAIALEGLLLSPVEPLLPGASASVPTAWTALEGPVLPVPGPVAMPPGKINRSRPRARYLLYYQAFHHQPIPWVPDFNSVGVSARDDWLDPFRAFDPLEHPESVPDALPPGTVARLAARGVRNVVIERRELNARRARALLQSLEAQGGSVIADDGARWVVSVRP